MEVGPATERDGQIDLSKWVCLRSWDHPVEGGARRAELRPGDVHGVKGVDVEDVEATASVHQHLGEVLLADDGVDDERVASWSCDAELIQLISISDSGLKFECSVVLTPLKFF